MGKTKVLFTLVCLILMTFQTLQAREIFKLQERIPEAVLKNINAIVSITDFQGETIGSGFIVEPSGVIVTNFHVIEAGGIKVKINKELIIPEGILGVDPIRDIAVLKIKRSNLPTVRLGSIADVRVGDKVFAIGNPLGLEKTVTEGIVSSFRDGLDPLIPRGVRVIQFSAEIAPGSSGGALFNYKGEVIGITTAGVLISGFGFAIPIDYGIRLIQSEELLPTFSLWYVGKDITKIRAGGK